jgi:hypothetical protein
VGTRAISTARGLGNWVRHELNLPEPDRAHIVRVITQETGRWAAARLPETAIARAVAEAPNTGSDQWDALIEGVVAHQLDRLGIRRPAWTYRTSLAQGWAPNSDVVADDRWYVLDVFHTPVELLEKGVILARHNLARL